MNLSNKILKLRKQNNLSQEQLAEYWEFPGSQYQSGNQDSQYRN